MEKFFDVIGTQPIVPSEIEICLDTVYIRSNIRRITIEHRLQPKEVWCYDEIQYEIKEYIMFIYELEKRQNHTEPLVERVKTATEVYEENLNKNDIPVDKLKKLRIQKLKEECTNSIYEGFTSVSTNHSFGFNDLDQANFTQQMLMILSDSDTYSDPILWKTLEGSIVSLNTSQFLVIAKEAEQHKRTKQTKYWELENQVLQATTIEDVIAVMW